MQKKELVAMLLAGGQEPLYSPRSWRSQLYPLGKYRLYLPE